MHKFLYVKSHYKTQWMQSSCPPTKIFAFFRGEERDGDEKFLFEIMKNQNVRSYSVREAPVFSTMRVGEYKIYARHLILKKRDFFKVSNFEDYF